MSRIIGRVVVGVSGSPQSLHALRHAVELARHYDATLIAVNAQRVTIRLPRPLGLRRGVGARDGEWQRTACAVLRAAFDDGLGGMPADIACMLLAAPGRPGPALVAVAGRSNDVLVLGSPVSRRLGRRTRLSVSCFCVMHACCSVHTVPPPPLAVESLRLAKIPSQPF